MNIDPWQSVKTLESDYSDYGGNIVRWETNDNYPDCSCGCKYFWKLDSDWGVCLKQQTPRAGLLTFEHQAGYQCFEKE